MLNKKTFILFILLAIVCSGVVYAFGGFDNQDAMVVIEEKELPVIKKVIKNFGIQKYGFKNIEELELITLGSPYQVYLVFKEDIKPGLFDSILAKEKEYICPVLVNGQWRTLMYLKNTSEGWKVVKVGGANVAKMHQQVNDTIDRILSNSNISKVNEIRFIKILDISLNSEFAVITEGEKEYILPMLTNSELQPNIENFKLYEINDFSKLLVLSN